MTGFTEKELVLGGLVAKAVRLGVSEEALGLGGKRTVGPLAHLVVDGGRCVYAVNGERGIILGRTKAEAVATLRSLVAQAKAMRETQAVA